MFIIDGRTMFTILFIVFSLLEILKGELELL